MIQKQPLVQACNASPYCLAVALSHDLENDLQKLTAFTTQTLAKLERNYLQIEIEELSLISGVKKLH